MTATLITIGDEILSGTTVDTNSNFIAGQLKSIGIKVDKILTISDEIKAIENGLEEAFKTSDLAILTGGLGPTRDDKTKKALAEFFQEELAPDETTFLHLKNYLKRKNREHLLEINKSQAEILSKATVFQNDFGTAPCQIIEKNGKTAICLPGVPFEVKPLIKDKIIPFLAEKSENNYILHQNITVSGIPESLLAEQIKNWEDELPQHISLSYLPVGSRIKLKLSTSGKDKNRLASELETVTESLKPLIAQHIISIGGETIEDILHHLLIEKKLTISSAESCTGGALAKILTKNPGSSRYFSGGIIAYQTEKKIKILKVSPETIRKHTVVSEETAVEMAIGCQNLFETDISISTTGVSGPSKGEDGNEVGTAYYSIRIGDSQTTNKIFLPHFERQDFADFVAQKAIEDLVVHLTSGKK